MAAQLPGVSVLPPSLASSVNLLGVHSNTVARALTKMLNGTGPIIDPWGTPLVSGLQLDFVLLITTFGT